MPIFHIETTRRPARAALRSLADALGALFDAPAGHVWVRIVPLDAALLAENLEAAPPGGAFVRVILRALPEEPALAERAKAITRLIAAALSEPESDVHVYFDPPAAGRIAFGGELVPRPTPA
jgi:phenylpyruvate tautomerase PptA (4-oxalocrotonate tautomerase family)